MKRAMKLIVVLVFIGGLVALASYAGARAALGKVIGPDPPLGDRSWTFPFKGVEALPDAPRAWVFSFGTNKLNLRIVQVFVSPTGKLLGTRPRDLKQRVEAYRDARAP